MRASAIVSFRLGGADGVSVESAKWQAALVELGFSVRTVAGEGPVDHRVAGLAIGAKVPPGRHEVAEALDGAELIVVENLCSLPLNPAAAQIVADVARGRPTVLHHHDLAWQRPHLAHHGPPPDDPAWRHVTINERSRLELADRGIGAVTIYNAFDPDPAPGLRDRTRAALEIAPDRRLVLQPTRALARKNVGGGLDLAAAVGGCFWLFGPPEDGFGPELEDLLARTLIPVRQGPGEGGVGGVINDAYAACDVVVLPSTWEGFGNPSVESAMFERPLAIGPYPVAEELEAFGFRWFHLDQAKDLDRWLDSGDRSLLEHNHDVAREHFSTTQLPTKLTAVLDGLL
jgi:mannosylglucosylglycerate synthase